ncbi:MAG: hypothetical protein LC792_12270 [Actinobacteria bacterium]|nr:hypothetical protein [Actinomycetota bacterium]
MGWKTFLLATLVLCSCSSGSSAARSQRIEVGYRDKRGADHTKVFTVAIGASVPVSAPRWTAARAEAGGQGQEGRTLILTDSENRRAPVGDSCAWTDKLGPVSPDGRYLVVWAPTDGGASEIHLVALTASPADVMTVPHSNSVDYVARTRDGRVWFTSDESPPSSTNRLFSYAPVSQEQASVPIDNAILIRSARTL